MHVDVQQTDRTIAAARVSPAIIDVDVHNEAVVIQRQFSSMSNGNYEEIPR